LSERKTDQKSAVSGAGQPEQMRLRPLLRGSNEPTALRWTLADRFLVLGTFSPSDLCLVGPGKRLPSVYSASSLSGMIRLQVSQMRMEKLVMSDAEYELRREVMRAQAAELQERQ